MQPSIEQTLRGMMNDQQRRDFDAVETAERSRLERLLSIARDPRPLPKKKEYVPKPKRTGGRSGDLVVAAFGTALGLLCAAFPWYIFMNPEKFGVRAVQFESTRLGDQPIYLGDLSDRVGAPSTSTEILSAELDHFPTGTTRRAGDKSGEEDSVPLEKQPFPGEGGEFSLVFASNGRAMISDDTGMWVVQLGSMLPDSSRVTRIEQRGSKWVLVTSNDRTLEASQQ